MPPNAKESLVGKQVTDSDGIEVGYVLDADDRFLRLAEGPMGSIKIGRRFVQGVTDKITLNGPASAMFSTLNVIDSAGEFVGIVRDTVESGDVLDSIIIEDEEGDMIIALIEDVGIIDEWVELRISSDELHEKQ